jgi:hypothetical protein
MSTFEIFNLMYLVLEELNEENKDENVSTYLSEANPYIWEGENSGDPAVFYEFKKSFEEKGSFDDYGYDFIVDYLTNIDYYEGLIEIFKTLTREEYVDTCDHIIKDQPQILKKTS